MKRICFVSVICLVGFVLQFFLFNLLGPWGTPHFLILCVVFFNLYWGIRHSLLSAFLGGFLLDVFSLDSMGTHIFALMVCAYLTIFIRRNFYQPGSYLSRAFAVGASILVYGFVLGILRMIDDGNFSAGGIFYAMIPELIVTIFLANMFFGFLKRWADRLI